MKYYITLMNTVGIMSEHVLELPVTPEIKWHDFESLEQVQELLLLNPTMRLQDVTPEGMPDWFTDEEQMIRQIANMSD
jgi:hypothetical protein